MIKLLKILDDYFSAHLSILVNESFESGIFPSKCIIARVISICKKGLTTKMLIYRPISLLSIFST